MREKHCPVDNATAPRATFVTYVVRLTREALEDLRRFGDFLIDAALEHDDGDLPDRALPAIRREFRILESNPFT